MAIKNAQFDHNEVRFGGASDFWDTPAGQIVSAEYFPVAAPVGDLILATAAITEVGDAVAGTVLVTEAPRIATLAITEAANTASSLVGVRVTANFSGPLEFPDSVEASAGIPAVLGNANITEAAQTASSTVSAAISGAATAQEAANSLAATAGAVITAAVLITEAAQAV